MPGKPFYSMEEVCERLGKSADQVKALVRDGVLREFRDAGKIFFKADDVEKLIPRAADRSEDTGDLLLDSADDSGGRPAPDEDLAQVSDTSGGTSIIGLEPLEDEETTEATDDSDSGEDKEDTVITASGIGVFDDDELEIDADPMAKTQITTGTTDDQVSLDGAGSGSGLLDLAREADDTALGADLLDEIYPGEETAAAEEKERPAKEAPVAAAKVEEPVAEAEAEAEETEEEVYEDADVGEVVMPVVTRVIDSSEGMFSGLLVGALVLMALSCSIVAGVVQGFLPDYGRFLGDGSMFYIFLGGSALLAVVGLLVGWFLGRAFVPRRR